MVAGACNGRGRHSPPADSGGPPVQVATALMVLAAANALYCLLAVLTILRRAVFGSSKRSKSGGAAKGGKGKAVPDKVCGA